MTTTNTEKHEFQAEVKQILDLVIHSLYSNKDIFLRELISNSSDAIDKVKFESLTNKDLAPENIEWKIKITPEKEKQQLIIEDNGIGLSHDDLINNLGTIAKSGTKEFLAAIKANAEAGSQASPELIGQFGVGFYSAYMVADEVTVITKKAGEEKIYSWKSVADGSYTIEEHGTDQKEIEGIKFEKALGTVIVLKLKEEAKEYLEEYKLREIIRQYSNYIEYPIKLRVQDLEASADEEKSENDAKGDLYETINSRKAIWTLPKSEVTEEDYNEFYKHVSHDFNDPAHHIHYHAEGTNEFKALLYFPKKASFDMFMPEVKTGLNLYIKRVFITHECEELLPPYLRFVKGVVDSSDLPLNVSREILQKNPRLSAICKNLVKKVLSELKKMKEKNFDQYLEFYEEFGKVLKEGVYSDPQNKEKILDLLLFESTKTESQTDAEAKTCKFTSLEDYAKRIDEAKIADDKKQIYYIAGESRKALEGSPYLEAFAAKDIEVLFMTDPIDEWITMYGAEYKGKQFKAINKGDIDLGEDSEEKEDSKENEEKNKSDSKEKYKDLLAKIQEILGDKVKEVKFSSRLVDTLCCLVVDEDSISANMERIYKSANQNIAASKRTLEINPKHSVLEKLNSIFENDKNDTSLNDYSELIYNQALLMEGSKIEDPSRFAKLMNKLIV